MIKKIIKSEKIQFLKAVFAGMSIALGAFASCGLAKPFNGIIFSTGLIIIVLLQLKLFTGSILNAKDGFNLKLFKDWAMIFVGNFVGCIISAYIILHSGYDLENLIQIGVAKSQLTFSEALLRGIFCNVLVCVAVYITWLTSDVLTKVIGVILPVTIFVISGYEHSVANMFYYTISHDGFHNLLPVTIGNIIGGLLVVLAIKLKKEQE